MAQYELLSFFSASRLGFWTSYYMRLQLLCWFLCLYILCLMLMCLVGHLYSSSLPHSVPSLVSSLLFSWLLKRITCCLSFQASQSVVSAKIHLPCRYFTRFFFISLYCHPYACAKGRKFSLVRLHSCINLIPFLQVKASYLCPASDAPSTSLELQNELPHLSHTHLWLSPLPSGDLCEALPLGPWALNCPNSGTGCKHLTLG